MLLKISTLSTSLLFFLFSLYLFILCIYNLMFQKKKSRGKRFPNAVVSLFPRHPSLYSQTVSYNVEIIATPLSIINEGKLGFIYKLSILTLYIYIYIYIYIWFYLIFSLPSWIIVFKIMTMISYRKKKGMAAYNITMRLLPLSEQIEPFNNGCRLLARHWRLHDG